MNHVPTIDRLRDLTKVAEYNIALKNRFEVLDTDDNLESIWGQFKQTVTDVSMEILGKRPRKVKEQHLSQKTKDLLIQRGQFKRKDPKLNSKTGLSTLNSTSSSKRAARLTITTGL